MRHFPELIKQQLAPFARFSELEVTISAPLFSQKTQKIAIFVQEIEQTALLLANQYSEEYANAYAERLFHQFEALKKAVTPFLHGEKKSSSEAFYSSFHFPKNIHTLSPNKRLAEYRKALRALNEKISWLMEKCYNADDQAKILLQKQIKETEYRKLKCLKAIEGLEEKMSFRL